MQHLAVRIDGSDGHLRTPEIGADRSPHTEKRVNGGAARLRFAPPRRGRILRRACGIDSSWPMPGINLRSQSNASRPNTRSTSRAAGSSTGSASPTSPGSGRSSAAAAMTAATRSRRASSPCRASARRGGGSRSGSGSSSSAGSRSASLAFAISAQIQKSKLADGVGNVLDGGPFLLGGADDPRPRHRRALRRLRRSGRGRDGELHRGGDQRATDRQRTASTAPYRSDTIMLIRAGGGTFRKLSIPRDTLADVPGQGPQKINSAYAFGGAKLEVRTVEDLLGIDIDQVAIIDFAGFRKFIDAIGGIDGRPAHARLLNGLRRRLQPRPRGRARTTSTAFRRSPSRAPARTRAARGAFAGDRRRAGPVPAADPRRDQGPADQPHGLPLNFIKGPLIGWNAPKAFVSTWAC